MSTITIQEGMFTATICDIGGVVLEVRQFKNKGETSNAVLQSNRVVIHQKSKDMYPKEGQLAFIRFEGGEEGQYIFDMEFPVRADHKLVFRFIESGNARAENIRIFNNSLGRYWQWPDRPKAINNVKAPQGKHNIHSRAFTSFARKLEDAAGVSDLDQFAKDRPRQISAEYHETELNAGLPRSLKLILLWSAGLIALVMILNVLKI